MTGVAVGEVGMVVQAHVEHLGSSSEAFGFDGDRKLIKIKEFVYVAVGRKGDA